MIAVLPSILISLLFRAAVAWGHLVASPHIVIATMGDCGSSSAFTSFADRTITIDPSCYGTGEYLEDLMLHEYGHLLCLCADHSEDTQSIMNPVVVVGNQIMEGDKWRITN